MNLAYIANVRLPTEKAHGIQIMKMCEAFARQGKRVTLLVPSRRNDLRQDPFDFYGVERIFEIKWLPSLDLVRFGFFNIGFFISAASFLMAAKIYVRKNSFDLIYSREQLAGLFLKKCILEIHKLSPRNVFFQKYIFKKAAKFIVLTNYLKEDLIKLGVSGKNILIAADAVDLKNFDISTSKNEARRKVGLPADKKIIMYTGSFLFYQWKGIDVLLKAAALLPEDYLFVLIGGHPHEIEKISSDYLLANVRILPFIPHKIIPYYLKSADVLVIPNKRGDVISERYTSPLKLFEYMASGRPIISSDLPSLREILTDQEAVFFTPDDERSLSNAIQKLIGDDNLQNELSQNAYAKASGYSWERRAVIIDAFIRL